MPRRALEFQAFAWGIVEALNEPLEGGWRDEPEVSCAGQQRRKRPMEFSTPPFCQGLWGSQRKSERQGLVKPVMLGEFVSVVEANGFAHRLWKLAEWTGDGPSGEDGFSMDRMPNDVEAGLPFVENKQPLATSGEQHEVGFPMARCPAAFDLGGPFGDRAPLFDEAGDAAASAPMMPSSSFLARQQAMPAILLSGTMIGETID